MHEPIDSQLPFDPEGPARAAGIDFRFVAKLIKRHIALLTISLFVGLALAVFYVRTTPPVYVASAKLLIESPQGAEGWPNSNMGGAIDSGQVDSQVEILRAIVIAEQVVGKLDLASDPEFAPAFNHDASVPQAGIEAPTSPLSAVRAFLQQLRSYLHPEATVLTAEEVFRIAVSSFGERISVRRLGQSDVIEVDFSAGSPVKAARIVKETLDAYLRGAWREAASPSAFHRFNDSVLRNSLAVTNARVISAPTPPLGKSSPKTTLVLAFATTFSLFIGLSVALWLEFRRSSRPKVASPAMEGDVPFGARPLREARKSAWRSLKDAM